MDTIRVDISYRPLRIAWAIQAGDMNAFRQAVQLSHALWGGRFNPIVVVEREEEAEMLVDLFHVDLILPVGDTEVLNTFTKRFPHLINPLFPETLLIGGVNETKDSQVLDIQNALLHLRDAPEWKATKDKGFRINTWQPTDPLADVLMVQFGMYPDSAELGIDYLGIFADATEAKEYAIDPLTSIQPDILEHPTIAYLSRYGLERQHGMHLAWDSPGFFVGDATCLEDLVLHWNLRAADIHLLFVDPSYLHRYSRMIPAWGKLMGKVVSYRHEFDRHLGVWSQRESLEGAGEMFGGLRLIMHKVSSELWNGHKVSPPAMYFGKTSTLGVISRTGSKPKLTFQLTNKPFCGDPWFGAQHLIASVSFIIGLYGDDQYTLTPPFIPELNEFYARTMHFRYSELRIEPEGIGLVIDAADTDTFIYALPVADLVERLFAMAGFSAKLSSSGLITRQLLAQLGGLRDALVFKIPGVRRLLKTHGPTAAFSKRSALDLIGSADPENSTSNFKEYQGLYIERRPIGTKLKPRDIFAYLVEKGLFRIGALLCCPSCRMSSWTALDVLRQRVVCDLCGSDYDATRQLVNGEWYYRRSGVLGAERNAQGAVPVALTLQQLKSNLSDISRQHMYSPSLDLEPLSADLPKCEIDFVWVIGQRYPNKTILIVGECKDQGVIDSNDICNLRLVADAFPIKRFDIFILLAKLCPFTQDEVQRARTLNGPYSARVILLTARELEPEHFLDRAATEFKVRRHASTPEDLALATIEMYFKEQASEEDSSR